MNTKSPLHQSTHHESGVEHANGKAVYVADIPVPEGTLVGYILCSPHAHARILRTDASRARKHPGIQTILFAQDIPGDNAIGPIVHDEPILASDRVEFVGQAVALIVGKDIATCRAAAAHIEVEYESLEACLSIEEAIKQEAYLTDPHIIARGDVEQALTDAPLRRAGEAWNGAQNHFYLETQAAFAIPEEQGQIRVLSSTQHPTEMQRMVAHVLGVPHHMIICDVPRMGGGFGGKESQSTNFGCLAALAAQYTGCPVKICLERDQDMQMTGNRHPFWSRYDVGFDETGKILAFKVDIFSDGGWVSDLSTAIMDRALFHLDNAYFIPALRFEGRVCKTNLPSNTAFRGFGGPQGMVVIEEAINQIAEQLHLDPAEVRRRNFYGPDTGTHAPYGQALTHIRLQRIWTELSASSAYASRRAAIDVFNQTSPYVKRGIGFQPIKFGISFTASLLNQAGALVLIYSDGSVQLNHGGTEMGQGLHTKMRAVCAHILGISSDRVRVMCTSTEKVPNTSPTAASSGSDLNGQAIANACQELRERMAPVAREMLQCAENSPLKFSGGKITATANPHKSIGFHEVTHQCWVQRVSLAATGFYATPGIAYDRERGQGTPFFYYAYGAAVVEVEVHTLTGEHRMRRADILHDVGNPLIPSIDLGQVEGAFIQGVGWVTCEEVLYDDQGKLLTHGPSTYKIPAVGDAPHDFRVALLDRADQPGVIGGSKAVGEPPFMLGIGVITALRHAILSANSSTEPLILSIPATPESILRAICGEEPYRA